MLRWSLMAELFSLAILVILFLRYYAYEWQVAFTKKRKLYLACLLTSAFSVVTNIFSILTVSFPENIPLAANIFVNSVYFFSAMAMATVFTLFALFLIYEHAYDDAALHRMSRLPILLLLLLGVLVILNLFSGILFYFDGAGVYQRGPLNRVGYLFMALDLGLLLLCHFHRHDHSNAAVLYVMRFLPPVVVLLILFQILYPEVLLNSILGTLASLILAISFQTQTDDRDNLTGLRNRSNFLTELSLRIENRQSSYILLVSFLDFSDVNLQHGYAAGDAVLYAAAQFLNDLCPQAHAFRTGNVTFALMMPWVSEEDAAACLKAVQARFQQPWTIGALHCRPAFCIAELHCQKQESVAQVMTQIEYTLRLAKKERGVIRFDHDVRLRLQQKNELIEIMRRAIQQRRFRVWYQPVYSCQDGKFRSAEALLRLSDSNGTPISPGLFIPLAEETGMIGELTWIVLEEVCRFLSSGEASGLEVVTLNLSMQQLLDPDLCQRIRSYLDRYGLSPSCLRAEITERFLLHDAQYAKQQLDGLLACGIQLYMDDFGTGYSNLTNVLRFPFSCIKLDRSLIMNVLEDQQADLMVRTLIALFRSMGKSIVVEGVESAELADYLQRCGADMIQGFYYARPMPAEEAAAFLKAHQNGGGA